MKKLLILSLYVLFFESAFAANDSTKTTKWPVNNKKFEFVIKIPFSVGFKSYQSLMDAAAGEKMRPGGGGGLEVGFGYRPIPKFEIYLAYEISFTGYYDGKISAMGNDKLSHSFAKHMIILNLQYVHPFDRKRLKALKMGIGPTFCVGTRETAEYAGESVSFRYKFTAGFNAEIGPQIGFKRRKNFILYPGLSFHFAQYKLDVDDNIPVIKVNGAGMGIFLGLIRKF